MNMNMHLDDRDHQILLARVALLAEHAGPRVGDYVVFSDGRAARISYLWDDTAQTSERGSWYLGEGYVSFSGALDPGIPLDRLQLTPEWRDGEVWFFRHNHHCAHNGVHALVPFRVYRCKDQPSE